MAEAAVLPLRPRSPALSGPAWPSQLPRTAAPIMTIMTAMVARPITAAARVYVDPGYSGGYGYYGGGPAYFNGHRDYYHDYRYR